MNLVSRIAGAARLLATGNRAAFEQLRCEKRLVIVSGATHLFEEPGALDEVARLAREWFERHLAPEDPDRRTPAQGDEA